MTTTSPPLMSWMGVERTFRSGIRISCCCPQTIPSILALDIQRSKQSLWWVSVHKRMWKAHFGAVDGAVARRLEHGEDVMIARVEDYSFGGSLCQEVLRISYRITLFQRETSCIVIP
jgi:hypothetical protein